MEHQIYDERVSEEALANPNFIAKQRAIFDAICAQAAARQEAATAEAQLQVMRRRITPATPPRCR